MNNSKFAAAINAEKPKNLKRAIEDYKSYLERLSKRSVPMIERHFMPSAKFKDPFFVDGDLDQRKALLNILCHSAGALKITVIEVLQSSNPNKVYFKWAVRLEKDMAELEGVSEIVFDHNFMIVSQDDYWDSASTVWAANPILRWAFRRGKKKMFGALLR